MNQIDDDKQKSPHHEECLRAGFESLQLPSDCCEWLSSLWRITQFFDDVADREPIPRAVLDKALWEVLVASQINTFFERNKQVLIPVMSCALLKWQAADDREKKGLADERSYVWRASYYDVVLTCVLIVHGYYEAIKYSPRVLELYGEEYEEYLTSLEE